MERRRFGVIGAGIIGAATAREIANRYPGASVTVLEKEYGAAEHQTGHNSGVVHAGLYYEPGSLKARLCRRGVELLKAFATKHGIAYQECGKVLIATNQLEEQRLESIHRRAQLNGVPDVCLLSAAEIQELEPNARGTRGLYSPSTAITDYSAITNALLKELEEKRGIVLFGEEVVDINKLKSGVQVVTNRGEHYFDHLVVCAGLQSDRVARMAGGKRYPKIIPFFGQYMQLNPKRENITNGLVYPVPDPAYPFLGVHLTKRVDGAMLVGPNAFLAFSREAYSRKFFNLHDSLSIAFTPGFWKFAAGNLKAASRELAGLVSRQKFVNQASVLVPDIEGDEARLLPRGVRAQAMGADGGLIDDFVIERIGAAVLIRNAPSPGATSSLAIAEYIVSKLDEGVDFDNAD